MHTIKRAPLFSALLALLMFPLISWGHVNLDKSVPTKGEVVSPAPENVKLWFSGGVETEWSKITVKNADGKRVDTGDISHLEGNPKALKVKLKALSAGRYKIKWNVVAHDGHRIKGSSSFDVK